MAVEIIRAGPEQSTEIEAIVRDLVEYHKLTGQSVLDQRLLESTIGLFSDPTKYYESFLAIDKKSGKVIGHCMYQKYFSFLAGKVIWMENLYVQDGHRGHKIGQRLLKELAKVAQKEGAVIQWLCIDWNVNSMAFYQHVGAVEQFRRSDNWICYQFDYEAINKLAAKEF